MDLIDVLLKEHSELRLSLRALEAHLGTPRRCGFEDCVPLDRGRFRASLENLWKAFREHESMENVHLAALLREESGDPHAGRVVLKSHRHVEDLLKVFSVVSACIQDDRVHAARMTLARVREELEAHLDEEERSLFPRLRRSLPKRVLREQARKALA